MLPNIPMGKEPALTNNKNGMNMEHEAIGLLKWLSGVVMVLIGYFVKLNRDDVKTLQEGHKTISGKVDSIQLLVVGDYVKRAELNSMVDNIDEKLDKIFDKLNEKEDKKRQ